MPKDITTLHLVSQSSLNNIHKKKRTILKKKTIKISFYKFGGKLLETKLVTLSGKILSNKSDEISVK